MISTRLQKGLLWQSDRFFAGACGTLIVLWAAVASQLARPGSAFNYNIYRDVARSVSATGVLPDPAIRMAHGALGSYADFSAANALVYRILFFSGSDRLDLTLFLSWQVVGYVVAVIALIHAAPRLNVGPVATRLSALLVASPLVSGLGMLTLEDKAWFVAGPLLVLAMAGRFSRALSAGVVGGWLGIGLVAVVLLILRTGIHGGESARSRIDLPAALVGGVAAACTLLVAGPSMSLRLVANRSLREDREPFAFSVWRLIGDAYLPSVRVVLLAVLVLLVMAAVYKGASGWFAGYVALSAVLLLVSTNTSTQRVVALVVIGVVVASTAWQGRWVAAAWMWAGLAAALAVSDRVTSLNQLSSNPSSDLWAAPFVLLVNGPLILIIGAVLWPLLPRYYRGARSLDLGADTPGRPSAGA